MTKLGRPPTCLCGDCQLCKRRARGRERYRSLTPEQRRAQMAGRDMERARQLDRERYWRNREARLAQIEARDPKKRKATKMVNARLAAGTMQKADACEDCGDREAKLTGHHEDYKKPLDVVWLCYPCHGKRHRKPDHEFVGYTPE